LCDGCKTPEIQRCPVGFSKLSQEISVEFLAQSAWYVKSREIVSWYTKKSGFREQIMGDLGANLGILKMESPHLTVQVMGFPHHSLQYSSTRL
jgi:hypothetical protein